MIFEDIANVMNARPVKEIMRKTGLTKNRVYSLRMGCTFHMDYELLFALQRMGYEVRVFAVGDPARQSRDGDGKILVRGDEVMAAKRTTAQGGFAQRNAAPDFARQTQKVGPVTVRAVSPQVKCDRTGARAGAGTEAACGKRGKSPAFAGTITSLRRPTFLALRK